MNDLQFKIASEPDELRQIRALNYRTFVEEIPQHNPNPDRSLVDRFDGENTYFVCRRGEAVVGMIAIRCNRPFSLDTKVPNLDRHLPPHRSACEVRLLAVDPKHRQGRILVGLVGMLYRFFETRGHDLALISGTLRQKKLYEHMGFVAFGPVVGTAEAPYQPMCQFIDRFRLRASELNSAAFADVIRREVNLLPGPVYLAPVVQAALSAKPVSHRSEAFEQLLERTRRALCELTGAPAVAVASGSGTLANDMVAGQLAQIPGHGLILSNGEFGHRLVDHASHLNLDFETLEAPWGEPFAEGEIRRVLALGEARTWLWAVHGETSTGVLNDLDMLKRISREWRLTLCLDCVSSLGVVPCDLRGVALASSVSGKGLRSMTGLALVFHDRNLPASTRVLPRYIDLRLYLVPGVPFTLSSNLVAALNLSLETLNPVTRCREVREMAARLRGELLEAGLQPLAAEDVSFPGAVTIPLPPHVNSYALGKTLRREGWLLSYQSRYLIERNWVQICPFGRVERADLEPLPSLLAGKVIRGRI